MVNEELMFVDEKLHNIKDWLKSNEHLWLEEWTVWSRSVALCSMGDFHWTDGSPTVGHLLHGQYLSFVDWKKESYIFPTYQLLAENQVFHHLWLVWNEHKRPLALVHPMVKEDIIYPMTAEYIRNIFDSPKIMCCMPYVIVGALLSAQV